MRAPSDAMASLMRRIGIIRPEFAPIPALNLTVCTIPKTGSTTLRQHLLQLGTVMGQFEGPTKCGQGNGLPSCTYIPDAIHPMYEKKFGSDWDSFVHIALHGRRAMFVRHPVDRFFSGVRSKVLHRCSQSTIDSDAIREFVAKLCEVEGQSCEGEPPYVPSEELRAWLTENEARIDIPTPMRWPLAYITGGGVASSLPAIAAVAFQLGSCPWDSTTPQCVLRLGINLLAPRLSTRGAVDDHFLLQSKHCQPTNLCYDFIGHTESLAADEAALFGAFPQLRGTGFDNETLLDNARHGEPTKHGTFCDELSLVGQPWADRLLEAVWPDMVTLGYLRLPEATSTAKWPPPFDPSVGSWKALCDP